VRRDNDKTKDSAPMMHPKFTKALSRKRFDQHFQANRKQLDHLQATELDTTSIIHCTPTLAKSLNLYIIFKDLQGIYIYQSRYAAGPHQCRLSAEIDSAIGMFAHLKSRKTSFS
jgi:hypothetical protein